MYNILHGQNTENQVRTVLSCKKCNEERCAESIKTLSKEETWARPRSYPLSIMSGEFDE